MRISDNLKKYKKQIILAPAFKLLEAFFDLLVPLVMADIIDVGILTGDRNYIISRCVILVALAFVGMTCAIAAQYFAARCAVSFTSEVRRQLFAHFQNLSYRDLDQIGNSRMITLLTSDCNQVQSGLNLALRLLLRSPLIVFGSLIMAFRINRRLSLIFLITIILLFAVVFFIMLKSLPMYAENQTRLDALISKIRENLTGVRVIRGLNDQMNQMRSFDRGNDEYTRKVLRSAALSELLHPQTFLLVNLAVVVMLYRGAYSVNEGMILSGDVTALYNYFAQILIELVKLANLTIQITKALASYKRINAAMQYEEEQLDDRQIEIPQAENILELKDVSFAYNDTAEVLSNLNLRVPYGTSLGVIGATGAGKTSLINLISGFYRKTSGEILFSGLPLEDYPLKQLRQQISIVAQKAVLFSSDIRENMLASNPEATDQQIKQALSRAQIDFPLDYQVQPFGNNFSGGQRQRLTIARGLLKNARLYIFDDCFSALDYQTQRKVLSEVEKLKAGKIIISQRISSIQDCDSIIVMDQGRIISQGSHQQLLDSCPLYRDIYRSQGGEDNAH